MTVLEKEMYGPVADAGLFAGCIVAREVRIADWSLSTKRIDMVAIKGRRLHAIELKVRDWRGALRQAYSNLYMADYSYAALWHEAASRADQGIFKAHGIGLLRVERRGCDLVLAPKRSPHVIPERRAYVRQHCLEGGGGEEPLPGRPAPRSAPAGPGKRGGLRGSSGTRGDRVRPRPRGL